MSAIFPLDPIALTHPNTPKAALLSTGNPTWYLAPARPLSVITTAIKICPPREQATDSHMLRPIACALEAPYQFATVAVAENQKVQYVQKFQVRSASFKGLGHPRQMCKAVGEGGLTLGLH